MRGPPWLLGPSSLPRSTRRSRDMASCSSPGSRRCGRPGACRTASGCLPQGKGRASVCAMRDTRLRGSARKKRPDPGTWAAGCSSALSSLKAGCRQACSSSGLSLRMDSSESEEPDMAPARVLRSAARAMAETMTDSHAWRTVDGPLPRLCRVSVSTLKVKAGLLATQVMEASRKPTYTPNRERCLKPIMSPLKKSRALREPSL
mmetsp:Transcript_8026/g.27271  ORF Transcript_8026/g.27271 Transcript_8026/m.27271 type:complete len:204 (+) Transcript_8026:290-901(+)